MKTSRHAKNLMPLERTIDRGRGCWNCIHFENGMKAREAWMTMRQRDLTTGLNVSLSDPRGENHPQVLQIRAMVATMDTKVSRGQFGLCLAGKAKSDFVESLFLCDNWTGVVGSSLATHGHKLDKLPDELKDDLDAKVNERNKTDE